MPTELRPLYGERGGPLAVGLLRPGYGATAVADINNANQVVGYSWSSYGAVLPFARPQPWKKATLWDGAGNPSPIEDSPNTSEALRINDAGNLLYYVSGSPDNDYPRRYFVGPVGSAVALNDVIEGENVGAVDLNDNGLLLGWRENADRFENFLYDPAAGALTILPPLDDRALTLIGVDNAGRVLASVTEPQDGYPVSLYYLPVGGDQWRATGIVTYFSPRLSKTGLVLATLSQPAAQSPTFPDWVAGYYDLNAASPAFTFLPRVSTYPGHFENWAADANAAGLIVGQLVYPGLSATLYRPSNGVNADLEPYFAPAGWEAFNALGVNDAGAIIGNGFQNLYTPQLQYRGWLLNPDRDARYKDANRRFSEFVRILIGVTGGGGGIVLPPGGGPVPIDPEGPRTLLDALSPERKDVITGMLLAHLGGALHDPEMRRELEGVERRLLQKALDRLTGPERS